MRAASGPALALAWIVGLASCAAAAPGGVPPALDLSPPPGFGTAGQPGPGDTGTAAERWIPGQPSEFGLLAPLVTDELIAQRGMTRPPRRPKERRPAEADSTGKTEKPAAGERASSRRMGRLPGALSGDRARLMLQSVTVPGWGQASLGQRRTAIAFALLEAGVWGAFTTFRIQEHMRRQTYERTAMLFAGIDLSGRDEEYRRIVGLYPSSEEYNRLVVRRDATNLYFGDPEAYAAYIAEHEIRGDDAWSWGNEDDFLRYRTERQATQRASKHAQDALAAALINRLVSVIHAARSHSRPVPDRTSWRVECAPAEGDPSAIRLALRADF